MDQETARQLVFHGGVFVLDGAPTTGLEFGIDLAVWRTGERFRGVKMIPPGLHFIYYSAFDHAGQVAPRTGFFHVFQPREVLRHRWDPAQEDVVPLEDEDERVQPDIRELDRFLGPYPYEGDGLFTWRSLTDHISLDLLDALSPASGRISAAAGADFAELDRGIPGAQDYRDPGAARGSGDDDWRIRFAPLDLRRPFPAGATATEITRHSLDRSWLLGEALRRSPDLLGELQYAFAAFLLGHSFPALERWKALVRLLCGCDDALRARGELYAGFAEVLARQILQIPPDLFAEYGGDGANFLQASLKDLLRRVRGADLPEAGPLRRRVAQLQAAAERRFGWVLFLEHGGEDDGEDDEDAPVVVDVGEAGPGGE